MKNLLNVQIVMSGLLETALLNVTSLHAKLEWGQKREGRSFTNARYVWVYFVLKEELTCSHWKGKLNSLDSQG